MSMRGGGKDTFSGSDRSVGRMRPHSGALSSSQSVRVGARITHARFVTTIVLTALTGGLLVVAPVPQVVAIDPVAQDSDCGPSDINWKFDNSQVDWTTATAASVRDAMDDFEGIAGQTTSGGLVDTTEVSESTAGTAVFRIATINAENPGTLGRATCIANGFHVIEISQNVSGYELEMIAAHELGHVFGLRHVGDDDSFDSSTIIPYMSTCSSFSSTSRTLSQDDASAINYRWPDLTSRSYTANSGFEDSALYWGYEGSPIHSISTTSPQSGVRFQQYRPTGSTATAQQSDRVFQTTAVMEPAGFSVTPRFNYRTISSGATRGFIYLDLETRTVSHGTPGTCTSNQFRSLEDANNRISESAWVRQQRSSHGRTTTWTTETQTSYLFPTADTLDVRISMRSTVRDSADNPLAVGFDAARILGG